MCKPNHTIQMSVVIAKIRISAEADFSALKYIKLGNCFGGCREIHALIVQGLFYFLPYLLRVDHKTK